MRFLRLLAFAGLFVAGASEGARAQVTNLYTGSNYVDTTLVSDAGTLATYGAGTGHIVLDMTCVSSFTINAYVGEGGGYHSAYFDATGTAIDPGVLTDTAAGTVYTPIVGAKTFYLNIAQSGLSGLVVAPTYTAGCSFGTTPTSPTPPESGQVPAGLIAVSGTNIVDATHAPVSNATLCAQLASNAGSPISARFGGGGQIVTPPVCTPVTAGAFSINLPDTSTTSPLNACLAVTVTDNISGDSLLSAGYGCVQPTSAPGSTWCTTASGVTTCNFDLYQPAGLPGIAVSAGPAGLSAYQLYQQTGGTLSLAAWLASLHGAAGTPGAPGGSASSASLLSNSTQTGAALQQSIAFQTIAAQSSPNLFNPTTTLTGRLRMDGSIDTSYTVNAVITAPIYVMGATSIVSNGRLDGGFGDGYGPIFRGLDGTILQGVTSTVLANTPIPVPVGAATFQAGLYGDGSVHPSTFGIYFGTTSPANYLPYGSFTTPPFAGRVFAVFADSRGVTTTEANGSSTTVIWQTYLASHTGMTQAWNDAYGGRITSALLDHYPGISLTNLGAVSTANDGQRPVGNTLAQDLAGVDEVITWIGANDQGSYPIGNCASDNAASNTFAGWINNFDAIVFAVKPGIHITHLGAYNSVSGAYPGTAADAPGALGPGSIAWGQAVESATQLCGQNWGARMLPLAGTSGFNTYNRPIYLNMANPPIANHEYGHPSEAGEAHLADVIAREWLR